MRFPTFLVLAAAALVFTGCLEDDPSSGVECSTACERVNAAKVDISDGRFAEAVDRCVLALRDEPNYTPARYCILVARVGLLSEGINTIFDKINLLIGMAPSPAAFQPKIDMKHYLDDWVSEIEDDMRAIDEQVYYLAAVSGATFNVAHVPIVLKTRAISLDGTLQGSLFDVYEIDLGGTWDSSEVLLLGALFNLSSLGLDYMMAHNMVVDKITNESGLDAFVAALLIENPELAAFDEDEVSTGRIFGDDTYKGLRGDLIAAASYLAGRESSLEGIAGANGGLREAIKRSAASEVTDAVIQWIDKDGDGNPEAIEGPIVEQVSALFDLPVSRVPTFLSGETFDAFYLFAGQVRDNAELGGDAVPTQPVLEALRIDAAKLITSPLLEVEVPALLALDTAAFLEQPLPVRRLLPYFFRDDGCFCTNYGLLGEWEMYGNPPQKRYYDFTWGYYENTPVDVGKHFLALNADAFPSFTVLPSLALPDDGVNPDVTVNQIPVLAFQQPSFGGLVHLDLTAMGGKAEGEATQASINEAIARLMKHYCVHTVYDGGIFNGRSFTFEDSCN